MTIIGSTNRLRGIYRRGLATIPRTLTCAASARGIVRHARGARTWSLREAKIAARGRKPWLTWIKAPGDRVNDAYCA